MERKRVFISWSGDISKQLAQGLRDTLLRHPELDPWMSKKDIAIGAPWFLEIKDALTDSCFGIACLAPDSSKSPWLNFEAGYLFGRLNNFKLLLFGEKLTGPLAQLQAIDGTNREDLVHLMNELISGGVEEAKDWVNFRFPAWNAELKEALNKPLPLPEPGKLKEVMGYVVEAGDHLEHNSHFQQNACYQHVLLKSLEDLRDQLMAAGSTYSVPAQQYPQYLISLQERHHARIKAVALVDQEEDFWQEEPGRKIRQSSQEDSLRVFVFTSPDQFDRNFEILVSFASSYQVYAMSGVTLATLFERFNKDFGIIEVGGSKVLVEYDGKLPPETVRFAADQSVVALHQDGLSKIIKEAERIPSAWTEDIDSDRQRIRRSVFGQKNTKFRHKPVAMSSYLWPDAYDEHEEEHPYYCEMMDEMIRTFSEHRQERQQQQQRHTETQLCRVLELGAGTGIFTKRLAALPDVECVALEIDWACFRKVEYKLREYYPRVSALCEDSRTYEAPQQFDCIFSSFSDHHIRLEDRKHYLLNVQRNLVPGGLFLVGDEFLRAYDVNDRPDWQRALEDYHNHIIEIAERNGDYELVKLERAALEHGLKQDGEQSGSFKVSCEQYEALLEEAGFQFSKVKIGPEDRNDIGGVYVYTAWV